MGNQFPEAALLNDLTFFEYDDAMEWSDSVAAQHDYTHISAEAMV